jgi:hypothetical protein
MLCSCSSFATKAAAAAAATVAQQVKLLCWPSKSLQGLLH